MQKKWKGPGAFWAMLALLGLQFGVENGGGKWAMMGWNWPWAERNGLG